MSRGKVNFLILLFVMIVSSAVAYKIFYENSSEQTLPTKIENEKSSIEISNEPDLGLTPEEFKNRYNKIAVQIDAPVIKSEDFYVEKTDDSFDFFGHMNYDIAVFGKIDTEGKITVLAVSTEIVSNYSYAFSKMKNIIGAVIYTFSPEVGGSEVWNMVAKVENDKNRYSELRTKKIIYGRMINLEDHESLMFMVKPKK